MGHRFQEIAFTEAVKARQEARGTRAAYARREVGTAYADRLGPDEAAFIAARDSFYLASVSQTGWPYIQHRGGPRGFVRILDDKNLGIAEFIGNRQYITAGNLDGDDRVSAIFMDYPNRKRLKLLGHARRVAIEDMPELVAAYAGSRLEKRVEAALVIEIAALDWNCPQFITPRFTADEIEHLRAVQA